ncbi:MAG: ornithine cyclodeaminase family protein [Actinomycetota bacterium]
MTVVLSIGDVADVVRQVGPDALMDELIERFDSRMGAFDTNAVTTMDRTGFDYDDPYLGLVEWMPTLVHGRRVGIKTVAYHPRNPGEHALPSVLATTTIHDTHTGRLEALTEATLLTALRTGAASAIATDKLAPADASTLGVVGAGAQAVTQIHAISRIRPITRLLVCDADPEVAKSLPSRIGAVGISVSVEILDVDELHLMLREADIICTCTSVDPNAGPVLPHGEHKPALHLNAVGADFPGKTELPAATLKAALVCPDVATQCLAEGEAQQLEADDLGPELPTLVRNAREYDGHRQQLTVFDSTGWAFEDLIVAELVLEHAARLGIGSYVDLVPEATDPYDPYALVTDPQHP